MRDLFLSLFRIPSVVTNLVIVGFAVEVPVVPGGSGNRREPGTGTEGHRVRERNQGNRAELSGTGFRSNRGTRLPCVRVRGAGACRGTGRVARHTCMVTQR